MSTEAKDDGSGGDNRSHKSRKAPLKLSPPTKQHPVFYRSDAIPAPKTKVIYSIQVRLNDLFQTI